MPEESNLLDHLELRKVQLDTTLILDRCVVDQAIKDQPEIKPAIQRRVLEIIEDKEEGVYEKLMEMTTQAIDHPIVKEFSLTAAEIAAHDAIDQVTKTVVRAASVSAGSGVLRSVSRGRLNQAFVKKVIHGAGTASKAAVSTVRWFLEDETEKLQQQIDNAVDQEELAVLVKKQTKLTKLLKQHIAETKNSVSGVKAAIDGFREHSKELNGNLGNYDAYLFVALEDISAAEKLEMIEKGHVDFSDAATRNAVIKKLTNAKAKEVDEATKENLERDLKKLMTEGQALVDIMDDVGIKSQPVSNLVKYGSAALSAYLSFQSGYPLSAISSISGLMSPTNTSAPSPEIMAALEEIKGMLEEIDKKLDTVLENQKEIISRLSGLESQINDVYDRLARSVMANRELLLAGLREPFKGLASYTLRSHGDRQGDRVHLDARAGKYADWSDLEKLRNSGVGSYWGAFSLLEHLNFSDINGVFLLKNYELEIDDRKDSAPKNISQSFTSLVRLTHAYNDHFSERFEVDSLLSASFVACSHIDLLEDKLANLSSGLIEFGDSIKLAVSEGFDDLLHAHEIVKVGELAANFHYVRAAFTPEGYELRSLNEIASGDVSTHGRKWLSDARDLCSLAIAQQALLSGDVLLPLIYELFEGELGQPAEDEEKDIASLKKQTLKVLQSEQLSVFRENLGLYFVRRSLWDKPHHYDTHMEYGVALENDYDAYEGLHRIIGTTGNHHGFPGPVWDIKMDADTNRPVIQVSEELKIPLPKKEWLASASYEQIQLPRVVRYLLSTLLLIDDHIDTYAGSSAEPESKAVNDLLLLSTENLFES